MQAFPTDRKRKRLTRKICVSLFPYFLTSSHAAAGFSMFACPYRQDAKVLFDYSPESVNVQKRQPAGRGTPDKTTRDRKAGFAASKSGTSKEPSPVICHLMTRNRPACALPIGPLSIFREA
jgi:hypothetical protein